MATWDVFHSDRLEVERGLSTEEVRAAAARGELRDDDLIRPSGTTAGWTPLAEMPALIAPDAEVEAEPAPAEDRPPVFPDDDEEEEEDQEAATVGAGARPGTGDGGPYGEFDLSLRDREDQGDGERSSSLEVVVWDDDLDAPPEEEYDPQDEDDDAAEFTLSRGGPERVEELDLAAMVDVAFQLVLFFLVTATTVLYKSLEVPRPNPESNPAAAAQGRSKTLDEMKNDFILVEIDPAGGVKIDREPVSAEMPALVERLRQARERTGRKAMLLSADFATPHRSAVLAYDAANEIGLGIAIARPSPVGQGPALMPAPAPAAARAAAPVF